ncbi:MAG TPA: multicopper oxidase family protein [Candidatus Paceibacterota bacterium]|nr:multicopper oxidase family protein [Candidatus Paceibacterota bacterium]
MKNIYIALGVAVVLILSGWYFSQNISSAPPAQAMQVVELKDGDTYDLTASTVTKEINGVKYTMLAYNGSIPGPLLKIPQGAEVTINFKNELGMNTLLHSHGVRMDNEFDGSQTSQEEMKSGETFSYKLKFPDVGVYWYHPHVREDYQQELGLYGNYLVVSSDPDYWSPVNREVPLVLDDILIEDGKINLDAKEANHALMGRFGNVMLVNGETNYQLAVQKGEVVRFYITNVANTRPFNFTIKGAKMKLVGGDGGAYERGSWSDSVVLAPSERAVVEVLFENSGNYSIQNKTPEKTYALGSVIVSDESISTSYASDFGILKNHTQTIQSINPFRQYFSKAPDKRIALTIDMMGMMGSGGHGAHMMPDGTMMSNSGMMMGGAPEGGIEWDDDMGAMNALSTPDSAQWHIVDQDTGKRDMDIDWILKRGEPVKIQIFNDPKSMHPMQHPIHFHGQRFLVVARDGVPQTNLVWKDTVLVKAGETIDILLDTSNPGVWMAHCHIAEHLEAGMMMKFRVE